MLASDKLYDVSSRPWLLAKLWPYVIMDGGIDPSNDKMDTLMSRARQRISKVKRLAKDVRYPISFSALLDPKVFRDIMVEEGVAHAHSIFEADGDLALLGKQFKCPVMADDSDYCIFDLPYGYIPLSLMTYNDDESLIPRSSRMTCLTFPAGSII
ncbi:Protein asteroid -like protein 1 [Halotydeus destructor]|nr:Protein asteroid -like protein 1 [Halotydeus destructor]